MSVDLKQVHEKVLKTQVRIVAAKADGSGTIIYSKRNSKNDYSSYALSCHHVISDAINVKKEWDSKLGREIKKEFRQVVKIEFFDYDNVEHGRRPINYSVDADIVAYDQPHDMALLKLRTVKAAPNIAELCTLDRFKKILIGDRVWACGCQLLHDPILTNGRITHMGDEIDYKDYMMSSASIIFGSSGGAIFLEDGFVFIGIPSRIDIAGWSSPVSHLGYFSPISRIYQFLNEQTFNFIHDPTHTEDGDAQEREKLKREERHRRDQLMPEERETDMDLGEKSTCV